MRKRKTYKKPKLNNKHRGACRSKRRSNKSLSIIDVPFSTKISRGTRATVGNIDFHYQKYANMSSFFNIIGLPNLYHTLFNIELVCMDDNIVPIYNDKVKLTHVTCKFIIFVVNVMTSEGNHANVALVNNHHKTIEFFEPHGHRKNKNSGIADFKGLYIEKVKVLKKVFSVIIPRYVFINSIDHCKKTSFQTEIDPDENTGFCITWCILFIHYRCLNPHILLSKLIIYLSKIITPVKLLKYAKFVEDTVKN